MDRTLTLPIGLVHARTTDMFDETNHPAGLRRAHRVADGVWGRLVVHSGALTFTFDDHPDEPIRVAAGEHVIIPPAVPHHLDIDGPVTFAVEFHRSPTSDEAPAGGESTAGRGDVPAFGRRQPGRP